jgi:quercetin 2,3-dioxygenase
MFQKVKSPMVNMGDVQLRQPIPQGTIQQIGPFLLLHHAGPFEVEPGQNPMDIGPHPHRGFDPVTFVFQGSVFHRDSLGNEQTVSAGGVQWMQAGTGIIHAEGPDKKFIQEGGTLEIIQLWINAPASRKLSAAAYMPVAAIDMPEITNGIHNLNLVSGNWQNVKGPIQNPENVLAIMGTFNANQEWKWESTSGRERLIYLLDGEISIGEELVSGPILLHIKQSKIQLKATKKTKALILEGATIQEPVASYGPFVMNKQSELMDAIKDYQEGKMGVLEP